MVNRSHNWRYSVYKENVSIKQCQQPPEKSLECCMTPRICYVFWMVSSCFTKKCHYHLVIAQTSGAENLEDSLGQLVGCLEIHPTL